jgi:hypothetical protein
MVKVTLEVPESLLADIYIAVGAVLQRDQEDAAAEDDSGDRADGEHDSEQHGVTAGLTGADEVCG